ncbi:hypothetical protein BA193_09380 [Yersinia pseudotuberculosis]|nr:hypothetical protein BLA52_11790 [Yersinia pseudotuberculosis]PSH26511.1 hypothetical protein BLA47_18950 [Yersinia pseudotuberculosis]PSH27755.1 hypothetical protein BLA50_02930 [Yersinia pseudotuberculosis]PSH30434.1 hypothetical protein BA197_18480 [Yersinia pseudotuberculosis]PSH32820.1 hypothetical protein BLA51_02895 [Yersinia pseudotuberculosis]
MLSENHDGETNGYAKYKSNKQGKLTNLSIDLLLAENGGQHPLGISLSCASPNKVLTRR